MTEERVGSGYTSDRRAIMLFLRSSTPCGTLWNQPGEGRLNGSGDVPKEIACTCPCVMTGSTIDPVREDLEHTEALTGVATFADVMSGWKSNTFADNCDGAGL